WVSRVSLARGGLGQPGSSRMTAPFSVTNVTGCGVKLISLTLSPPFLLWRYGSRRRPEGRFAGSQPAHQDGISGGFSPPPGATWLAFDFILQADVGNLGLQDFAGIPGGL